MVKVSNNTAVILLKRNFDRILNSCHLDKYCVLLEDYLGEINEDSISHLSESVELMLGKIGTSKSINKKAFAILIEGIQNIYRHGLGDENGKTVGGFLFQDSTDKVQLHFLNLVNDNVIKNMVEFCEKLNAMSLEEIKALYMETLSHSDMTVKGGASLGCMLMKLKSEGNLSYKFESVDKGISCFHLIVNLMK